MSANIYVPASLYVGDLHEHINEEIVMQLFSKFGAITGVRVCRNTFNNKSLGYAYVNFQNRAEAQTAMEAMNYHVVEGFEGKPIRVSWQMRDPTLRRSNLGNIFIKNLSDSIDEKDLHDTLSDFGNILSLKKIQKTITNKDGSKNTVCFAFCHFEKVEDSEKAISVLNGKKIEDKIVSVEKFKRRDERTNNPNLYTNLYFKPFPEDATVDDVKKMFEPFGKIQSATIMKDKSGRTKTQFGFCNFFNHEDAVKAETELNGKEINGGKLIVNRAQDKRFRETRLRMESDKRKREMKEQTKDRNLYIKNLSESVTDEKLRQEFGKFGEITSCVVMKDKRTGVSRGFGFCCFKESSDAQKAMENMRNSLFEGKTLVVNLAQSKEEREKLLATSRRGPPMAFGYPPNFPPFPMGGAQFPGPYQFHGKFPRPGMPMMNPAQHQFPHNRPAHVDRPPMHAPMQVPVLGQ